MKDDRASIVRAVKSGNAVLLLGAGFSRSMLDRSGRNLPIGSELVESLWPIAFGNEPIDEHTSLAHVYEAAKTTSPTLLNEELQDRFQVDRNLLPERYKTWFSLPWHRIYTLNIDDADEAIGESAGGPDIQSLSALNSMPGDIDASRVQVIHINGQLKDFPKVTFSQWEFAERTATPEPWYLEFSTDIATRAVVVVGSVIDEPPLWHFMTLRGRRGDSVEMRPKSWVVSPTLDIGRKSMLSNLNFRHLELSESEFYERVIAPSRENLLQAQAGGRKADQNQLHSVEELVRQAEPGTPEYLLGNSPTWGDVINGYSADFEFDAQFFTCISSRSEGTVGLRGSAGSGKTTSMMKAAAKLSAEGNSVYWLDRESEMSISNICQEVETVQPDYLFIDDADRFSGETNSLLSKLRRRNEALVVVVAVRSGRFFSLNFDSQLRLDESLEQSTLTDLDAQSLIEQLERGKRLGAMRRLTNEERVKRLTKRNRRQLLVTLIEATSGEKFHNRIARECSDLPELEKAIYGVACTAIWADNKPLSTHDLLFTVSAQKRNDALAALANLRESKLLIKTNGGYIVRHRVVAESAIEHFRAEGLISSWVTELIILAGTHYERGSALRSRMGRMLIRLINHKVLRKLVDDNQAVSKIYGDTEYLLDPDYHFWLQRGSYEIDYGDLRKAENFLEQAKYLVEGDVLVDTAWAQLQLKRALEEPNETIAKLKFEEAQAILHPIMRNIASNAPHAFAIFLKYGLRWVQERDLDRASKNKVIEDLKWFATTGKIRYRNESAVQDALREVETWMQANGENWA